MSLLKQIKVYEIESKDYEIKNIETIKHEVEKAREKYEILLQEKDKQNQFSDRKHGPNPRSQIYILI
jgi:hypothetical protein